MKGSADGVGLINWRFCVGDDAGDAGDGDDGDDGHSLFVRCFLGGGGSCRRQRKSAAPLGGGRRVVARWVRPKVYYCRFILRFRCIRVGAGKGTNPSGACFSKENEGSGCFAVRLRPEDDLF